MKKICSHVLLQNYVHLSHTDQKSGGNGITIESNGITLAISVHLNNIFLNIIGKGHTKLYYIY